MSADAVHLQETDNPTTAEYAAYTLSSVTLIALATGADRWVLVVPLLACVALHPLYGLALRLEMSIIGYLMLALPFAALSRLWKAEGRGGMADFNTFYYLGLYLQVVALLHLYGKRDHERLPRILLMSAIGLSLCGADIEREMYLALVLIFAVAAIVILRGGMRQARASDVSGKRNLRATILATVAVFVMWVGLVTTINATYHRMDGLLLDLMRRIELQSGVGFSNTASLGDVTGARQSAHNEKVALRAYAPSAPGYLRGRVFVSYRGGSWINLTQSQERRFSRSIPGDAIGRFLLPGRPEDAAPAEDAIPQMMLYPSSDLRAHFFLPLETVAVEAASTTIKLDTGSTMTAMHEPTSMGYGVFVDASLPVYDSVDNSGRLPYSSPEGFSPIYLDIPDHPPLQSTLARILREIGPFSAEAATADRVREAISYFHRTRSYKLGIRFRRREDPIVQWLNEHETGHCELFASSGVLVLRAMGIPARYVTGFVCNEPAGYGDYYVARNRHAHAWVEYFDPKTGWRTAEFTPASGVPTFESKTGLDAFFEYLQAEFDRMRAFIAREGVGGLIELLLLQIGAVGNWILSSVWRTAITVVLLGVFFYYRLRDRMRRRRRRRPARVFPKGIAERRQAYLALEKQLARKGLARGTDETLWEYADRLASLADDAVEDRDATVDFIRAFADERYAPFS